MRERAGMGGGQDKGDDIPCTPTDRSSASEKVQGAGAGRPCPATGNAGQVKQLDLVKEGHLGKTNASKDKSWLKVLL